MRVRAVTFAAALLLAAAATLAADDNTVTIATRAHDGAVIQRNDLHGDASGVDVIIEFRDAPLFAPRPGRIAATAMKADPAARAAFERRFAQLADDLHGIARSPHAATVTHTFYRLFSGASAHLPREAVDAVRGLPYVARVVPDREIHVSSLAASVPLINADQVWMRYGTRGKGIVVAVIDTGADYRTAALGGGIGPGYKVIGGYDFVHNTADPLDDNGHGTHVSGIIAADGGGLRGVAPDVSLLEYKVINAQGTGDESAIIAGIERAIDPNDDGDPSDHASVLSLSLGGPDTVDSPLSVAAENAAAAGAVVCVAAGNEGDFFTISSPANAPSVIAVGASDLGDVLATFSSKGPTEGTLSIKPEVVAPGVAITSAAIGGGTLTASGTSMATPHVSGVAALLRAIHADWSPADVKAAIVSTAIPLGNEVAAEGGGRVDALRAASVDLLASTATVGFGRDDDTQSLWSATRQITLRNVSATVQNVTASVSGLRAGVAVAVDPSSFSLGAGESRTVTVSLSVTNEAVPPPQAGSLSFGGLITFADLTNSVHLPWEFTKAAQLHVAYEHKDVTMAVFNNTFGRVSYGTGVLDMTVPAGRYDVVITTTLEDPMRFIVQEQVDVAGSAQLALSPSMAVNPLHLEIADVHEALLTTNANLRCTAAIYLGFPNGGFTYITSIEDRIGTLFSNISARYQIDASKTCRGANPSPVVYSGEYAPLAGLNAPQTLHVGGTDWRVQPVRVVIPPGAPARGANVGAYAGLYLVQPRGTSFFSEGGLRDLNVGQGWNGTFYLTPEHQPGLARAAQVVLDAGPNVLSGIGASIDLALNGPFMHAVGNTVKITNSGGAETEMAPGETATFGDGPVTPRDYVVAEKDGFWGAVGWHGSLDEYRLIDANFQKDTLYDGAGNVVRAGGTITGSPLPPGPYRLESIDSDYRVAGAAGTATFEGWIDTSRADAACPQFTSMRIVDDRGRTTSSLGTNSDSALVFSAIDRIQLPTGGSARQPIRADATRVDYRLHGTTTWKPLPVTVTATEFDADAPVGHPPAGTTFRADLKNATTGTVGFVDLRVHVEDPSGNAIEAQLEPGMMVGTARRRPVQP